MPDSITTITNGGHCAAYKPPPPPPQRPDVVYEDITTDDCKHYMATTANAAQRRLRMTHVEALADVFRDGGYCCGPDPICFDVEGNLRNGQNRLAAQLEAGIEVLRYEVRRNVSEEVLAVMDQGAKRSASDVRYMQTKDPLSKRVTEICSAVAIMETMHSGATTARQMEKIEQLLTTKLCKYLATEFSVLNAPVLGAAALVHPLNQRATTSLLKELASLKRCQRSNAKVKADDDATEVTATARSIHNLVLRNRSAKARRAILYGFHAAVMGEWDLSGIRSASDGWDAVMAARDVKGLPTRFLRGAE